MMTEATLGEGNTPLVRSVQIGPRARTAVPILQAGVMQSFRIV